MQLINIYYCNPKKFQNYIEHSRIILLFFFSSSEKKKNDRSDICLNPKKDILKPQEVLKKS